MGAFVEAVQAASGGRIEITKYPAGTLVPSNEIHEAVAEGVIEMGYSAATYDMATIPQGELFFCWPFVLESVTEFLCLERNLGMGDLMKRLYGEHNLYPIAYHTGPYYGDMMSTKPMHDLDDIKGLNIRTYGTLATLYERLGASIVQVPAQEMYTALATGVLGAASN